MIRVLIVIDKIKPLKFYLEYKMEVITGTENITKPSREIRDGQEVIIMPIEEFNQQFRKKRKSQKQKVIEANNIDMKYLKNIQYRKKDGVYSFKITNIPSIEELKRLIKIQETYPESQN